MITCPNCNTQNEEEYSFCRNCGGPLQYPSPTNQPTEEYSEDTQHLNWRDIAGLVGFISAIAGFFWCAAILLPVGLIGSLIGLTGKKLRSIAIAGLIIAFIGAIIWICGSGFLPTWMIEGVF